MFNPNGVKINNKFFTVHSKKLPKLDKKSVRSKDLKFGQESGKMSDFCSVFYIGTYLWNEADLILFQHLYYGLSIANVGTLFRSRNWREGFSSQFQIVRLIGVPD